MWDLLGDLQEPGVALRCLPKAYRTAQGSLTPDMILLLSLELIWVSWGDRQWIVNANPNGLLMSPTVPHFGLLFEGRIKTWVIHYGAGKMTQLLGPYAAVAEDTGSVLSTHTTAHNCL